MPFAEWSPQSFIVKVWIEDSTGEAGRLTWRGHITHVPDGERRHLDDLDAVTLFIAAYLLQMGVHLGVRRRLWLRLASWRHRLRRR